jgi:hypothetical protein
MFPLVLALSLAAPADPLAFHATGTGAEAHTGVPVAISLALGVQLETADGEKTVKGLVSLRRTGARVPAAPVGPQLITAAGDRIPGTVKGGDAKVLRFTPELGDEPWSFEAVGPVAAVWLAAPPADTPPDPANYAWLAGTPSRDVLLYRNGDTARGAVTGFVNGGAKFTPDGGTAREVPFKDLAAIGFNPRFARVRKPKGPYAHLVLTDGTRLDVTELAIKDSSLVAKAVCGPAIEVPLKQLVALDVLQGPAVYLSDLKPKKAESVGFLGGGWPWSADRTVRGQPLRLLTEAPPDRAADPKVPTGPVEIWETTADKGIGTHPKTVLTYDLAGKYARFEANVGLDAATGKRGRADVRVLLDGKEVDLPGLKALAAGPAVPIRVDVKGAKELTLVVDFGPTGDVQADVNWGEARLVSSE